MVLEKQSPCKVNLLLNILGKRTDGFHELETVLHPVPVCDLLIFQRAGGGICLECSDPALPCDSTNLVHRAAAAFLERAGIGEGIRIRLEKRLPVAAGLGGGSANAATTLRAMNEIFGAPLPFSGLVDMAVALGSDVPFFLQNRPALGSGRGERIVPLDFFSALRGLWIILAHPGFGISTPWAYRQLSAFPEALQGRPGRARRLVEQLGSSDGSTAFSSFYNALEAPVLRKYPLLALVKEFFQENGARAALMSGSGSSTFALADSEPEAGRLLERFASRFGGKFWTATAPLDQLSL